ncbi:MAG: hypothetical protein Q7R73_02275 [bacterium]|nr:hypothetical protein [bacterium]
MTKSLEQPIFSENGEGSKNQRFEELVKDFVEESSLFPERKLNQNEDLDIIRAIENNKIALYLGNLAKDKVLDAVHRLVAIYDELGRDKPDENFKFFWYGALSFGSPIHTNKRGIIIF